MVTASIFILIAYKINKDFAWPMLAWPMHIIVDFFTHSIDVFPTPIFWPISDFRFDGIPWSNPEVWFPNISGIIILFIYRFKTKKTYHDSSIDSIQGK